MALESFTEDLVISSPEAKRKLNEMCENPVPVKIEPHNFKELSSEELKEMVRRAKLRDSEAND